MTPHSTLPWKTATWEVPCLGWKKRLFVEGKRRVGKGERAEGSSGEGSKATGDYCGSHISVPEASKLMCS